MIVIDYLIIAFALVLISDFIQMLFWWGRSISRFLFPGLVDREDESWN